MTIRKYLLFVTLSISCFACGDRLEARQTKSQMQKEALLAYDAFNEHLLHPDKKIYSRDTDHSDKVGAIWTQAIYWDMAMNAYKATKKDTYLNLVNEIYKGNKEYYAHFDWNNDKVWFIYDDIMWWVISLARGYEITGETEWLALSESGFERVWNGSEKVGDPGSYDSQFGGGMFWHWNQANPSEPKTANSGKMACINYPTVIAAMTLYNITGKETYLSKAIEIYDWATDNLFDSSTGRVADSRHGPGNPDWTTTVYNQGTCIGAAMMLYVETRDQRYLDDATLTADYTKNVMSSPSGILPYRNGEEQGIYTAIFAQYIIRLMEDGNKPEYRDWLQLNVDTGWENRDKRRNLTGKNYNAPCPHDKPVSCYDASGIPALMIVLWPNTN